MIRFMPTEAGEYIFASPDGSITINGVEHPIITPPLQVGPVRLDSTDTVLCTGAPEVKWASQVESELNL